MLTSLRKLRAAEPKQRLRVRPPTAKRERFPAAEKTIICKPKPHLVAPSLRQLVSPLGGSLPAQPRLAAINGTLRPVAVLVVLQAHTFASQLVSLLARLCLAAGAAVTFRC